jgi:hypothetical protein
MKRREFIAGLGSAVALPLASYAQQPERMRRIGVLIGFDENDPEAKADLSAFTQALAGIIQDAGSSSRGLLALWHARWPQWRDKRCGKIATRWGP